MLTGQFAQGCDEAVARAMAGRIRKARLVTLDGLMNGLLTEAPERVADELASFFGLGEVTPAAEVLAEHDLAGGSRTALW